jgi:hypothetical protein
MHVDLETDDREKETARLVELGATRGADHDEYGQSWTSSPTPKATSSASPAPDRSNRSS